MSGGAGRRTGKRPPKAGAENASGGAYSVVGWIFSLSLPTSQVWS